MHFSELISFAAQSGIKHEAANCEQNIVISHVCIDNRKVETGSLFICISGEKNDGHNYAEDAIKNGAVALIAEKNKLPSKEVFKSIPILFVENTTKDIEKLAHAKRLNFQGKVIALTGTAGKTCLKEMLFFTLSQEAKTCKNYLNYNTQIGVSMTILAADNKAQYWCLEAGISQEHDMDELGAIIKPDIALVLNVGAGHAEGLPQGSAYYKSKLFSYLKDDTSLAFANEDYEDLKKEALQNFHKTQFFSINNNTCPNYAHYLGADKENKGIFEVKLEKHEQFKVETALLSPFSAENVLACCLIASHCNISIASIQKALKSFSFPEQRFDVKHYQDITIIDDSYNANPLSFKRMLVAAKEYTKEKSKPLIIIGGSMLELGDISSKEHYELGVEFSKIDADCVFFKGDFSAEIHEGIKSTNKNIPFYPIDSIDNFIKNIQQLSYTSAVFFIKGSRSIHLEAFAESLKNYYSPKNSE